MAKYQKGNYYQVPMSITPLLATLPAGAQIMYYRLKELENKYQRDGESFFYCADSELAELIGCDVRTVERHKTTLKKAGIIENEKASIKFANGKHSTYHVTHYKINDGQFEADKAHAIKSHKSETKEAFGGYGNVKLTSAEYDRLKNDFGSLNAEAYINKLDTYIETKGKQYANHDATIRKWISEDNHARPDDYSGQRRYDDDEW